MKIEKCNKKYKTVVEKKRKEKLFKEEDMMMVYSYASLSKIRGIGVATRVDDVYTRGEYFTYTREENTSRIHTKPKVT